MDNLHRPVLLNETIDILNIRPDGIYCDLTFGRGGHSAEIAARLGSGRLICFDKDDDAIAAGRERFRGDSRVEVIKSDFRDCADRLSEMGIHEIDGAMMDIGVSSPQLDDAERGFSYMKDAPLDMRMDRQSRLSAWNIVNEYEYEQLRDILYRYGEEKYSPRIAKAIIDKRPIGGTAELSEVIAGAMPAAALREKQHPAKRTFQAIRIAVNDELGALEAALKNVSECLRRDGVLAVITFHSLEDRIVKEFFRESGKGCTCPPSFPVCVCGKTPRFETITRKPVTPGSEELEQNPRARSAKLRALKKL